jgi:hypothetical protein
VGAALFWLWHNIHSGAARVSVMSDHDDYRDSDDYAPPKTPLNYITFDQLQDMWGAGFTVIRRNTFGNDVYELADRVKRPGMARQWVDKQELDKFVSDGWVKVGCEDYPGLFAPFGYVGLVEIGTLALVECPQHRVDRAKQAQVTAAEKLVTDWQDKYGGQFSGSVTVAGQTELGKLDSVKTTKIGATKTIENTTAIPKDMVPYIAQIFAERDYLSNLYASDCTSDNPEWSTLTISEIAAEMEFAMKCDPNAPKWPTLNGIILPHAVANVRKRITEEANSAKAS